MESVEERPYTVKVDTNERSRFLALPYDLRRQIYECCLERSEAIDLKQPAGKDVVNKLQLLYTCRKVYEEAYPIFYGKNTFQIFPTFPDHPDPRLSRPLLAKLPSKYRQQITSLQLRFEPSWKNTSSYLIDTSDTGFGDLTAVRTLKTSTRSRPSSEILFARGEQFEFQSRCGELLWDVLVAVPSIKYVELEAYESGILADPFVSELVRRASDADKWIAWSSTRGWYEEGLPLSPRYRLTHLPKLRAVVS